MKAVLSREPVSPEFSTTLSGTLLEPASFATGRRAGRGPERRRTDGS